MPQYQARTDEGNYVTWRTEDGAEVVRESGFLLPRVFEATFPDDRGGPMLKLLFEVRGGVPQCRGIQLQAADDGREIRPADVRSVDVELYCEIACQLTAMHVIDEAADGAVAVELSRGNADIAEVARQVSRARRNTRRQIPDHKLDEVARMYLANPKAPTKAVQEHFGLAPRTASLYVARARSAGLLPPREQEA